MLPERYLLPGSDCLSIKKILLFLKYSDVPPDNQIERAIRSAKVKAGVCQFRSDRGNNTICCDQKIHYRYSQ